MAGMIWQAVPAAALSHTRRSVRYSSSPARRKEPAGSAANTLRTCSLTSTQGLALVHFSTQVERILWDRGAFKGCLGGA